MFVQFLKSKFNFKKQESLSYPKTVLQGVVMGIVETIPGVSASTLALIMGIYERFVDLLHQVSDVFKEALLFLAQKSSPKKVWQKFLDIDFKFGGTLFFGMVIGIAVFSHIMSFLLEEYTAYTYAFFFGLIIASISVPWARIKVKTLKEWSIALGTFVIVFLFLGVTPTVIEGTPSTLLVLFGGFFAICAMVLPGISGSFVLLLFGLYDYIIGAVKNLTKLSVSSEELTNLFALGIGLVLGFAIFVRILKYILEKYPTYLMAALAGLMAASLRVLWPFAKISESADFNFEAGLIIIIVVVTSAIVVVVNKYANTTPEVLKEI